MTDETKQLSSIFPDYPREQPAVDKEGNLNPLLDLGLGSLFQALQDNYRNEGIRIPVLSQSNINTIQSLYNTYIGGTYNALTLAQPDISGQTVYNTNTAITNQFVITQDNMGNVNMAQWVPFAMMLTGTGSPSGVVAAQISWLYYDTADMALYICTASGSATTAAWQTI